MNAKNLWEAMKELSDKQFKVYMAVYKLADNEVGYCFSGDSHIGEKINKSRSRVNQTINELIELNFLNVLKITQGTKVIERRLYTADCYKCFLKDSKLKIMKTTYDKKVDSEGNEHIIYFNEKNSKKITSAKTGTGTSADIGTGTSADIGTVTSTNIKVSKINKLKPKKLELVPFENFFKEELKMNFTATNQKAVEKLLKTMSEQQIKKFLMENYKMAIIAKEKNSNIKSINGLFVDYLKKGQRILSETPKDLDKDNSKKEKVEIVDSSMECIQEQTEEKREIQEEIITISNLTEEEENKAIETLIKQGINKNHLIKMKNKSNKLYLKTLNSALRNII
ncbi:helix-turn-helix domain-containing protein [Cetobacterium sp.]|uniref:helix-turn-helix domain-containing protein n=1 Tax=Cetobacterium sp. TaxID=2071632 RepID=UPI003F3D1330